MVRSWRLVRNPGLLRGLDWSVGRRFEAMRMRNRRFECVVGEVVEVRKACTDSGQRSYL